mmetsp:Transcript_36509/g.67998  ORF Transcript_36509/g.67998 Transcript_36509/m.67998 type:complete len:246 (-) Transcript_36509:239-976(-)
MRIHELLKNFRTRTQSQRLCVVPRLSRLPVIAATRQSLRQTTNLFAEATLRLAWQGRGGGGFYAQLVNVPSIFVDMPAAAAKSIFAPVDHIMACRPCCILQLCGGAHYHRLGWVWEHNLDWSAGLAGELQHDLVAFLELSNDFNSILLCLCLLSVDHQKPVSWLHPHLFVFGILCQDAFVVGGHTTTFHYLADANSLLIPTRVQSQTQRNRQRHIKPNLIAHPLGIARVRILDHCSVVLLHFLKI